jgi:hypothetical protein
MRLARSLRLRFAGVLLVAFAPAAGAAEPRPLTEAERATLTKAVDLYERAFASDGFDHILSVLPPPFLPAMATMAGVEVDTLRQSLVAEMAGILDEVQVVDFGMDLDDATTGTLAGGQPYAVIPTWVRMKLDGLQYLGASPTLAILDGDDWYFVRIEGEAERSFAAAIYPDIAAIDFPPPSLSRVE